MSAQAVYAEALYSFDRGYPLRNPILPLEGPDVCVRGKPVQIGDVGYIFRGAFHRLFNVHLLEDHPEQSKDLPEQYQPIGIELDVYVSSLHPQVFHSTGVRVAGPGLGGDSGAPFVDGEITFTSTGKPSAALAILEKMVCENARGWKRYQDYVLEHSDRWLALSERRGLGLRMEDIILVTGRDLTASWANIVFASAERGITSELHVDFTSGAPRRVSGIRWTNAQSVVVQSNWGPSSMASELDEPLNTAIDQCLFIRYISAKPRRLFLHKQLLTNRLPLVPTSPPAEHHTIWSVRHSRGTKSSRKGPEQTTGLASAEFTREDYEAGGALVGNIAPISYESVESLSVPQFVAGSKLPRVLQDDTTGHTTSRSGSRARLFTARSRASSVPISPSTSRSVLAGAHHQCHDNNPYCVNGGSTCVQLRPGFFDSNETTVASSHGPGGSTTSLPSSTAFTSDSLSGTPSYNDHHLIATESFHTGDLKPYERHRWCLHRIPPRSGAVYFSNPELHLVTNVDLRDPANLERVCEYVVTVSPKGGWEMWLRGFDGERADVVWINHEEQVVSLTGPCVLSHESEPTSDYDLDDKACRHYWSFVHDHPAHFHHTFLSHVLSNAMDLLVMAHGESLHSPATRIFAREDCLCLMKRLEDFKDMPRSEAQLAIRIRTAASIFLTFYMDTSHTPNNEPRILMRDGEAGWVSYIVWMVGITDFSTLVYILFVGFSILR